MSFMAMKKLSVICILFTVLAPFGLAQNRANQFEILLKQGEVYLEDYEFEKALVVCDKALKMIRSAKQQTPAKLSSVYFLYGKIYEKGLFLDKAIESYTTAIKFNSKNPKLYQNRANIYQYIGETEKSETDFAMAEKLIEAGNDSNRRKKSRTNIPPKKSSTTIIGTFNNNSPLIEYPEKFQIIRFKEVADYEESVVLKDLNKDGKISDEEFRAAHISRLKKLIKLVEFNPQSDLALWKRGSFYLKLDEVSNQVFWISTESDFLNAFDLNPRFEYLNNVGVVRARRDNKTNYEFAIKRFSDALEINNECLEALYNRGLSYLKLNENEKAIADFTRVVKLNKIWALAYKSRAKAFRAIGKTADADADEATVKNLGGK